MRFAIFSDIHGNLPALEQVLYDIERVGEVDQIWCLGDLALFGPQPAACIARLREMREQHGKEKFRLIGGNTDRYLVTAERSVLPPCQEEADFDARRERQWRHDSVYHWTLRQITFADYQFMQHAIGREIHQAVAGYGSIIGVHAIPGHDEPASLAPDSPDEKAADALLDREGRLLLAGHTHLRMDRTVGRWRVLNPGSVGMSFSQPGAAEWLLLTVTAGGVEADFRSLPYDMEGMIARAERDGYPDAAFLRERLFNR